MKVNIPSEDCEVCTGEQNCNRFPSGKNGKVKMDLIHISVSLERYYECPLCKVVKVVSADAK